MTRGDEDIEGGFRKFLDTRKGGSEKIRGEALKICILHIKWTSLYLIFLQKEKKWAYAPLCVFGKTRVSCYKLCEENKSIKWQMLALKIIPFASSAYEWI